MPVSADNPAVRIRTPPRMDRPPPSPPPPSRPPSAAADVERYLHKHIPLTRAMRVEVRAADADAVRLSAPLSPNVNHLQTAFGGSASALATLAAWTLLHVRLQQRGFRGHVVIQRHQMEYLRPITGGFTAECAAPGAGEWAAFEAVLARRGRGRIELTTQLTCDGAEVGRFRGSFVALRSTGEEPESSDAPDGALSVSPEAWR